MSIGARSQSAKTYLEANFEQFPEASLEELIKHGLHALRDTLQQDKELTIHNTSLGIVGLSPSSQPPSTSSTAPTTSVSTGSGSGPDAPAALGAQPGGTTKRQERFEKFKIVEGEDLQSFLDKMDPKDNQAEDGAPPPTTTTTAAATAGEADVGGGEVPRSTGEEMQTD